MKEIVVFDTQEPDVKINHRDLGMSLDDYIAGSVRCGFREIPARVIVYSTKGGKLLRILLESE